MSSNPKHDYEAWEAYPKHHRYFNKLDLALRLGYRAGPSGTAPSSLDEYIVRPAYNLEGMGLNARFELLGPEDGIKVKPGEFWCERFYGHHISVDYRWNRTDLTPYFACQGFRARSELYRFTCWKCIPIPSIPLPKFVYELTDVTHINVEFIGDKIIEIHLRPGSDFPEGATDIIPLWSDDGPAHRELLEKRGWKFKENHEDAGGHMEIYRVGFMYR